MKLSQSGCALIFMVLFSFFRRLTCVFFRGTGKFIIWAAATMLIQAERKDSTASAMTLPLAEKLTVKVLQEKVSLLIDSSYSSSRRCSYQ